MDNHKIVELLNYYNDIPPKLVLMRLLETGRVKAGSVIASYNELNYSSKPDFLTTEMAEKKGFI